MRQGGWTCQYVPEAGKTSTLKDPLKEAPGRLPTNAAKWNGWLESIGFSETTERHERENVKFLLFCGAIFFNAIETFARLGI